MSRATLALLFFLWPSTSARYGLKTHCTFRAELLQSPQYSLRTSATIRVHRKWRTDHTQARANGGGCLTQASPNYLLRPAALRETLSSLRGGESGSSDQVSVLTLLVRVFVPSFQRESEANQGGLDLEGGGLMRRISRLVSGILRQVPGFARRANANGGARGMTVGEKKGKKKENQKQSTASHLQTAYRPGNANYRIQKELKEFLANPPDGCKVSVGKNIRVWIITISGAEGTIYAGEKFRLRVAFPEDYPTKPPAVYFLQSPPPPKHQHIYTNGDICLSLLSSRDWKPNLTVMSLALSILSMLSSAKEKRIPEDNAAHADARPGQAQQWIYHDDLC